MAEDKKLSEQRQREIFQNGRPVFSDEEKMSNTIKGLNGIGDSSAKAFLKNHLQPEDTTADIFDPNGKKMDASAKVFFPRGANI